MTGLTGELVDLGDFSQVSGDQGTMIKLHASFMVLAWLLFANVGTFCARYCKDIFTVSIYSSSCSLLNLMITGQADHERGCLVPGAPGEHDPLRPP